MTASLAPNPAFWDDEDFSIFTRSVERFFDDHATTDDLARWRKQKVVERDLWKRAGAAGLLGVSAPVEFGGGGGDFRHEVAIIQAVGHRGAEAFGITLHNPVVIPYLCAYGTEMQKARWLPSLCNGDTVSAIAMTEPSAGSDLQALSMTAKKERNGYRLSGQKTFITNGQLAGLILVAAKTDPSAGARGVSLFLVDAGACPDGFQRGRNLDKIGQEGQDTSELFFDDVLTPHDSLLGDSEGQGFFQMMEKLPQERLVIAWQAMSMIERALSETIAYVRERPMFGQHLMDFQNTQFRLAECKTEATIAKVFVNYCTELLLKDQLEDRKSVV